MASESHCLSILCEAFGLHRSTINYRKAAAKRINVESHTHIPNVLNRDFCAQRPNQYWCGDVTYIWIGSRWPYLAVVLDLYGRKLVGWGSLTCQTAS